MLEKISVLSAEDSHALQQKYTLETPLKLQLTQRLLVFLVSVSTNQQYPLLL